MPAIAFTTGKSLLSVCFYFWNGKFFFLFLFFADKKVVGGGKIISDRNCQDGNGHFGTWAPGYSDLNTIGLNDAINSYRCSPD